MFGYRFRTFGTGANRLTEGWKASIMSEIGVGDCMAERREWVCDTGIELVVAIELSVN